MCDTNNNNHFLMGFLTGAALGFLFAPKSGKETRRKLKREAEDYFDRGVEALNDAKEVFEDAKDVVEPAVRKVEQKLHPIAAVLEELSEPYRKELEEKIDELMEKSNKDKKARSSSKSS